VNTTRRKPKVFSKKGIKVSVKRVYRTSMPPMSRFETNVMVGQLQFMDSMSSIR